MKKVDEKCRCNCARVAASVGRKCAWRLTCAHMHIRMGARVFASASLRRFSRVTAFDSSIMALRRMSISFPNASLASFTSRCADAISSAACQIKNTCHHSSTPRRADAISSSACQVGNTCHHSNTSRCADAVSSAACQIKNTCHHSNTSRCADAVSSGRTRAKKKERPVIGAGNELEVARHARTRRM